MRRLPLPNPDRAILFALGLFLGVSALVVSLMRAGLLEPGEAGHRDRLLPAPSAPPADAETLEVGVYIENNYLFSVDDKTFNAVGRIWLNWPERVQTELANENLPPEKWLNWVNLIDSWDSRLEPVYPAPIRLADGRYHQSLQFSGQFYVAELDFRRFPFQRIRLPVVLELSENLTRAGHLPLALVPDREDSGVGLYSDLIGYRTIGFDVQRHQHEYGSRFGLNPDHSLLPAPVPQVMFATVYQQSVNAALLKLFLPLVVVMALVLLSPMLSPALWEVRLGIPPTALLTLVFLQQGYREKLPDLPYATYLDMVYNACYVVNLLLFGLFLWASNRLHQTDAVWQSATVRHIDRIDRRVQVGLCVGFTLLLAIQWFAMLWE